MSQLTDSPAWQALAAAFGPLLVMTLWYGPVAPAWRIAALSGGFALTVALDWTVDRARGLAAAS